jgi:hypothetical protein
MSAGDYPPASFKATGIIDRGKNRSPYLGRQTVLALGNEDCRAFPEPLQFGCRNHEFCMTADQTDENVLADVDGALIYIFDTGKINRQFPWKLLFFL